MSNRIELQDIFIKILGSNNVYYQPPESLKIKYPAIIYNLSDITHRHANNKPYLRGKRYLVRYIDKNVDSEIPDRISDLPMCLFIRFYTDENVNNWVFELYF